MSNLTLNEVICHIRDRDYMSGVERDQSRIKATGEVFTPYALVKEVLDNLPPSLFTDSTKTFLDNSCGDGQFLGEVLIRKMENGSTFEEALSTIYGVDLMPDNIKECRKRLLCGRTDLEAVVNKNIVCHDALSYDYSFNGTDLTNRELLDQRLGIPKKSNVRVTKVKKSKPVPLDIRTI